uniref:Prefoldin subunit 5 n=2 Tax=Timema TaxID=61471 RepID=A0A7R9AMV0_TIMSH|nr:unnamed protein product [Timema shepardi]CAD7402862.1 unnamed protein product [Timema poppensis]
MATKEGMEVLDLTKLGIQQLTQIKQQLDQELSVFNDSLTTLKMAQGKFRDSNDSLEKITPSTEGKSIMVPLTGSMYIPGRIADGKTVIIDIGTGYYIQKDVDGAKDYFKRKVTFVTEQMEKISTMGLEKNKLREAVMDVMEMHAQAQLSAQKQQASKS